MQASQSKHTNNMPKKNVTAAHWSTERRLAELWPNYPVITMTAGQKFIMETRYQVSIAL